MDASGERRGHLIPAHAGRQTGELAAGTQRQGAGRMRMPTQVTVSGHACPASIPKTGGPSVGDKLTK